MLIIAFAIIYYTVRGLLVRPTNVSLPDEPSGEI